MTKGEFEMRPTRREFLKSSFAASLASGAVVAVARSMAQTAADSSPRTVRTGVLDIAYEEHGDANGAAIILLQAAEIWSPVVSFVPAANCADSS